MLFERKEDSSFGEEDSSRSVKNWSQKTKRSIVLFFLSNHLRSLRFTRSTRPFFSRTVARSFLTRKRKAFVSWIAERAFHSSLYLLKRVGLWYDTDVRVLGIFGRMGEFLLRIGSVGTSFTLLACYVAMRTLLFCHRMYFLNQALERGN